MDTLLSPLYFLVSWIMIGWHWVFAELDRHPERRRELGVVDHRSGRRDQDHADPVVRATDQGSAQHADAAAEGSRNSEKVQRRPGASPAGDDEAVQGHRHEPVRLVHADHSAGAVLVRSVPGAATASRKEIPRGAFITHPQLFESAEEATIFGAPLSASFLDAPNIQTKIIAIVMVVLMTLTTFLTQRQIMRKNMPKEALEGPFAQQQKILLYVLPWSSRSRACTSRSASSSTGSPPTCGPWVSSST